MPVIPALARASARHVGRLSEALSEAGFCRVPPPQLEDLLGAEALTGWDAFAESWNVLGLDTFMADGGRYRRRRFAAFAVSSDGIMRKPHQPHYQSRAYNSLNGGVERWFDPVADDIAGHPVTLALLGHGLNTFHPLTPAPPAEWHIEMHQFRIEADHGGSALPTPEGPHRDGVDWVIVMLVGRQNVTSGVTDIFTPQGEPLGAFMLEHPRDAVFLNDHEVLHGVTPIQPLEPGRPARRDVLVLTFRATPPAPVAPR